MDSNKQTFVEQDSEMKQTLPSDEKKKKKKNRTPKEPWEPKSKDKLVASDKPKQPSGKGKRSKVCDVYNDAEDQYMCMERAALLLERLDAELPKFAKCMLPSNVLYSFWLILPKKFCVLHLPEHDTTITLVDESGKEFKTNYLNVRHGLSAGWRGFSIAQKLLQGDILFFHLIQPCKLQVNIVRRYGLEAIEAAICLMQMHPRVKKTMTWNYFGGEPKKQKLKHKKEPKEGEVKNENLLLVTTKKGKRSRRSPKKFIICSSRGNVEVEGERVSCERGSDAMSSQVHQVCTSEITDISQPDEVGCYTLSTNCHTTAPTMFHSSTVAT